MNAIAEALDWPFFTHAHRDLHARLERWLADPDMLMSPDSRSPRQPG